ncbi:MAG: hypothetical protein GOP50_10460 [Candidatus Heimdallarchaeota archaeon]|nr:hypothetical protein [Candidatus Heimdallarchaeota archaeon]
MYVSLIEFQMNIVENEVYIITYNLKGEYDIFDETNVINTFIEINPYTNWGDTLFAIAEIQVFGTQPGHNPEFDLCESGECVESDISGGKSFLFDIGDTFEDTLIDLDFYNSKHIDFPFAMFLVSSICLFIFTRKINIKG